MKYYIIIEISRINNKLSDQCTYKTEWIYEWILIWMNFMTGLFICVMSVVMRFDDSDYIKGFNVSIYKLSSLFYKNSNSFVFIAVQYSVVIKIARNYSAILQYDTVSSNTKRKILLQHLLCVITHITSRLLSLLLKIENDYLIPH